MNILKKKRKVVRAAFGRIYYILNKAISKWDPTTGMTPKYGRSGVITEKSVKLAKVDEEVMNLLLQEEAVEEEPDKEMQSADEYASKYKRINLYVQKRVSAAIKVEDDSNSISNVTRGNSSCPLLNFRSLGVMSRIG